jgi:hypothetical protein
MRTIALGEDDDFIIRNSILMKDGVNNSWARNTSGALTSTSCWVRFAGGVVNEDIDERNAKEGSWDRRLAVSLDIIAVVG